MVEYGNIVPNMAKIYLLKSGEVRDPLGLDNFHPNSNVNGIIVHIEGGSPSNIATMAFNPNIKNFLATHNFPLFYRGQVEHTVGNEAHPRTFAQYIGWVPNIVLALNVNKNTTMSVGVTVNQQSGIELLGAYKFIADLPDATEDIDDCVAYVWEEDENGYYQVKFNVSTQSYGWVKQSVGVNNHYNITTKKGIFTKQFNVFYMTIQKGFANPNAITQLEDEQYRLIWKQLADLSAFIEQNTTLIGELQEQIDELNLHVVKTVTKQDTNTIAITLTRLPLVDNNNVEITAVVRVDSDNVLNILEITQDGLLVDKTNVYDFIVEQFNDTNSDLHIAVLDLINDKLDEHNTSLTAHQDIRESIEEVEQAIIGLDNNKLDKTTYASDKLIIEQNITNLDTKKLDKVWNNITSQTITNLNDEFVLNRGGAVYKTTLANMLSNVVPIDIFIVVSELPEFGVPNKIYLVSSEDPELQNTLDEFIWVNNDWERIGGISIDLSNYFNKTEINSMLESKVDKNANITVGTHPKITYDAKGLVTGGGALVAGDIPLLSISKTIGLQGTLDSKQDKLVAGDNITIDENTNVISASGGSGTDFYRVRIFDESDKLVTTQIIYDGEKVLPLDKPGYLFYFGTRNEFNYDTVITEDLDLTYSIIPPRYIQTTTADFDSSGDYTGTEEYIILPADKTSGYKITNINVKGVATNGDYLTSTYNMFNGHNSLYLELDYLNTSNVTSMSRMFVSSKATELDVSGFDTSNVTDMGAMFSSSKATTLDLSSFDTSSVTDMSYMFSSSRATTLDLSNFNTSNVTSMSNMFENSKATTLDLSSFDTSSVTDMSYMFSSSRATTLDLSSFDTSSVTDMSYMFSSSRATTLDLSNFNTSNVTSMSNMFSSSRATTLDLSSFDTSKVTRMQQMFLDSQATTLDLSSFDTSSVTDMSYMFVSSKATTGYARTQTDADNFNSSSNKPSGLTFVVK